MNLEPEHRTARNPSLSKRVNTYSLLTALVTIDSRKMEAMSVNELSEQLTSTLRNAVPPKRESKRRTAPWFDPACFQTRRHLLHLLKESSHSEGAKTSYCAQRRFYRNLLEVKKKLFAAQEERRLTLRARETPHTLLKQPFGFRSSPIPAEELREYFQAMFQNCDTVPNTIPRPALAAQNSGSPKWEQNIRSECRRELESHFTQDEVHLCVAGLKNNEAFGADLIRNEHLKNATAIIPSWTLLFNRCPAEGVIPDNWPKLHLQNSLLYAVNTSRSVPRNDSCTASRATRIQDGFEHRNSLSYPAGQYQTLPRQ